MHTISKTLALLAALGLSSHAQAAQTYTITDLGSLGGGGNTYATGINNSGQVVGNSRFNLAVDNEYHAFLYSNGIIKDLGSLGGIYSTATGINNSGQVVGYSGLVGDGIAHSTAAAP